MDIDYELIIKVFGSIALGSGSIGGLLWTIRKMYESYLNRNKYRELTIKKGINGDYDINAKGLTVDEMTNLVKQLPIKEVKIVPLQFIKNRTSK